LIELDNLSTPIGSKLAAESAVKQEVTAILGAAWSSHTLAMAPVAQASGTPLISTISTTEEVTRTGDYIFRVCFTDAFQGRIMAKFARETLHAKSAVTVTDLTSDYGLGLTREFEANFQNLGGHITRRLDYRIKQADFKELAMEVKAAAPQVVFIPGYWESAVIIQAIRATGSAPIFMGGDGWGTERFFERGGTDIPKAFYSTHWAEDIETNQSRAFVRKYKQGSNPLNAQEALAYDAVFLLADAIRRAGTVDREKVRDAIAATVGFTGVTGGISYQKQRDPVRSAVIMEIEHGKARYFGSILP
jgi:branched-chain amino acid transport system substrate-binding protein